MTTPTPYSGIRILDLTHDIGRYATRLFADLGADVIRVEPPGGLADRHRLSDGHQGGGHGQPDYDFAFFNASKKSVIVDFDSPPGRIVFEKLAATAQIVFLERAGPLADELGWVRGLNPEAVVAIVSPYGLGGPMENAPAGDLTMQAAGGIAWMSGRPEESPLCLPVQQATMVTSVYAAAAAAMALFDAEARGRGHLIDVSAQECIAHSLQNAIQVWDLEKHVSIRGGEGTRDATEDIFPCKDGYVFLASPPSLGVSWKQLLNWMQESGAAGVEELQGERWSDRRWRTTSEARTLFRDIFSAFMRNLTKVEITHEAAERKIVLSQVSRIADVLDDEQLHYRGYFRQVKDPRFDKPVTFPGPPYLLSESVWNVSAAPELGADQAILSGLATAS